MKSIIEEASSISKAIENAWKQAGQPSEFSVRVYEAPQKNMFGFTTKSAKIGIFFDDYKKPEKVVHQPSAPKERPNNNPKPVLKEKEPILRPIVKQKKQEVEQQRDPWSKEMITYTQDWLNTLFAQLNIDKQFTITPERYHLKISFDKAVFEQDEKNRAFFRNCAHLLLQSIRNTFKRPLKGFKIILTVE